MTTFYLNGRTVTTETARAAFIRYAYNHLELDAGSASAVFTSAVHTHNEEHLDYLMQSGLEIAAECF